MNRQEFMEEFKDSLECIKTLNNIKENKLSMNLIVQNMLIAENNFRVFNEQKLHDAAQEISHYIQNENEKLLNLTKIPNNNLDQYSKIL